MTRKKISLINKMNNSKDGKSLVSNFKYLMLLQIASYVFPLVTIPYLARVIGVDGYGKVAFAAATIMWFKTITDWGFNYTATRDVARNRENSQKVSEIFSNVLWAKIFLMLVSFAVLMLIVATIPYFKEYKELLIITFLTIPGYIFYPSWYFQAVERMKYITIFDLLSKALFTALVFVFIKEKSDYLLQPLFIAMGSMVSGWFAMYFIVGRWKVKILAPNIPKIISTIKGSTNVFINNIMPNFYNNLTVILLGYFGGAAANGIYDAGRKFVNLVLSMMEVGVRVIFPFLSRKIDAHDLFAKLYLTAAMASSLLLLIISSFIIELFFTAEFEGAVYVLRVLSFSVFFVALTRVYGINYLIIQGLEGELRNITVACSIFGFVISLPLVYYFSYMGAAFTLVITQAVLGFSVMFKALKVKKACRA